MRPGDGAGAFDEIGCKRKTGLPFCAGIAFASKRGQHQLDPHMGKRCATGEVHERGSYPADAVGIVRRLQQMPRPSLTIG